jgi:hypothetical protein
MEFRLGDGMGDLTRFHADIGLRVQLARLPKLIVTADFAYRQAFWHGYFFDLPSPLSSVEETWIAEFRPQAALTVSVPLGKFTLANTIRLDVRFFQNDFASEVRFHEQVIAALDIQTKSGYAFRLFAAVGFTALFHPDPEYNRTRIYAGLMFPFGKTFGLSIYYMWQRFRVAPGWWSYHLGWTVDSNQWWDHHILGLSVTINLNTPADPLPTTD